MLNHTQLNSGIVGPFRSVWREPQWESCRISTVTDCYSQSDADY